MPLYSYNSREARLALRVGLLCCHQRPVCQPWMGMVISYLNGEETLPEIDDIWGFSDSSVSHIGLRAQ